MRKYSMPARRHNIQRVNAFLEHRDSAGKHFITIGRYPHRREPIVTTIAEPDCRHQLHPCFESLCRSLSTNQK